MTAAELIAILSKVPGDTQVEVLTTTKINSFESHCSREVTSAKVDEVEIVVGKTRETSRLILINTKVESIHWEN